MINDLNNDNEQKKNLTKRELKHLKHRQYRKDIKDNKKYIKDKTINKNIAKQSSLASNLCIQATNLIKIIAYKNKRYELIKGINLDIYKKDFVMIFGESGSGKTTLLSLLSALDRPSEGNVNILGNNTACLNNANLIKLRNKYIGYIFQQYGLLKEVSVIENIIITLKPKQQHKILKLNRKYLNQSQQIKKYYEKLNKKYNNLLKITKNLLFSPVFYNKYIFIDFFYESYIDFHKYNFIKIINNKLNLNILINNHLNNIRDNIFKNTFVYQIMKKLEIDNLMNHRINDLSGGQQQRISICRAIVKKPEILFADEPTGAVDANTAKIIMEIFIWLNKYHNTTIIIVTHNNKLINLSNHIIFIENGKIIKNYINEPKSIDEIDFK